MLRVIFRMVIVDPSYIVAPTLVFIKFLFSDVY